MYKGKYGYHIWVAKRCIDNEPYKVPYWKTLPTPDDSTRSEFLVSTFGMVGPDAFDELKNQVKELFPKAVHPGYDWDVITSETLLEPNNEPDWKPAKEQGCMFRMLIDEELDGREKERYDYYYGIRHGFL